MINLIGRMGDGLYKGLRSIFPKAMWAGHSGRGTDCSRASHICTTCAAYNPGDGHTSTWTSADQHRQDQHDAGASYKLATNGQPFPPKKQNQVWTRPNSTTKTARPQVGGVP